MRRCLQHDPAQRPTARELLAAVQQMLEEDAVPGSPGTEAAAPAAADRPCALSHHTSAASLEAEC